MAVTETGHLTTLPYLVEDAPAFIDYMNDLVAQTQQLQDDGRIPRDPNVRDFIDFWRSVVRHISNDLRSSPVRRGRSLTTQIPMTEAEYKATWNLLDPINSLIVVLEARGAVQLNRTDAAIRVLRTIYRGTFE